MHLVKRYSVLNKDWDFEVNVYIFSRISNHTFAGLGLFQQVHDGFLCLLQTVLEGLVTHRVLARVQVVNQGLQVMQFLSLLVHLL